MMKLLRRLHYFVRQRRLDSDLAEEIEFHREMKQRELECSGVPPAEARYASLRALGNITLAREEARAVWIRPAVEQLARDVRIGARTLLKAPLFTIFATLVLSIAIGANVTVFLYLNAIFFKPLDVPEPDRLVRIFGDGEGWPIGSVAHPSYVQYRDSNQAFSGMGMYFGGRSTPIRTKGPRTLPLDVIRPVIVSDSLFKAIGIRPALGRNIESQDEQFGSPNVVMLNNAAWRQYFASDPNVVGRYLFVDNRPHVVVGIVPDSFDSVFQIIPVASGPRVYLPVRNVDRLDNVNVSVFGRLKPAVSRASAQADLSRIAAQISAEKKFWITVSVEPSTGPPSWLWVGLASLVSFFLIGVFVVLLIACDDIAILLLARIAGRQREMGVRLALGASRAQLVRQLVAENLILAILGGAGATIFALATARALENLQLPVADSSRLTADWRVILFTTAVSLATTLFFGLRPALQCVSKDVVVSLNPGSSSTVAKQSRIRSNLVVTQITVCTALLVTAGVLVRSTQAHLSVDRGFKSGRVLLGSINLTGTGYDRDALVSFYERFLTRIGEAPGIISACVVGNLPVSFQGGAFAQFGGFPGTYAIRADTGNEEFQVSTNTVTRGYFDTLRIPLVDGRDFTGRDDLNASKVGIVNEALARRLWPNENPVGRHIRGQDGAWIEVIAVAGNIRSRDDEPRPVPVLYRPLSQVTARGPLPNTLMVRTAGEPMLVTALLQAKIAEIDPNLLVYGMHTLEDRIQRTLLPYRVFAYVAGVPGIFALLLGVIGTYGTMALVVAERRREIGIRIALGAHPSGAVSMMTKEGMKWTLIGLCLGTAGAFLIALWLSRNFYGLDFFDPVAFAAMMLLVASTAGTACYIPARRASRVDPIQVLREE